MKFGAHNALSSQNVQLVIDFYACIFGIDNLFKQIQSNLIIFLNQDNPQ